MKKTTLQFLVAILAIFTLTINLNTSAFGEDLTGSGLANPDEPIGDTNRIWEVLKIITNRPPDTIKVDGENPPLFVWANSIEKISVEKVPYDNVGDRPIYRSVLLASPGGMLAVGQDGEGYKDGFSNGDEKLYPIWEGVLEKCSFSLPRVEIIPPRLGEILKEEWTYVGKNVGSDGYAVFFLKKKGTDEIVSKGERELLFGTVPKEGTFFLRKVGKWFVPVVEKDGRRFIPLD